MRLIDWPQFLEESPQPGGKPSAVTVGVFDGVHRGHKALIERVVSRNGRAVPALVTFRRSHYKKSRAADYPGDILSFRQKTAVFESLGIVTVIVIEFSESFRRMPGAEFLRILRERGGMDFLAVGSNFRCGYQLDTDAAAIRAFNGRRGIITEIVEPLTEGGEAISSSRIRAAVTEGKLEAAAAMLGRPFTVDLAGAAAVPFRGGVSYDIAGQGRILPPDGKYPARLFGENRGQKTSAPSLVTVEGGKLRVGREAAACREYAEFLS